MRKTGDDFNVTAQIVTNEFAQRLVADDVGLEVTCLHLYQCFGICSNCGELMAIVKDWIREAAEEIYHGGKHGEHYDTSPALMTSVIRKHCPFKEGALYMEVPRCEFCQHWKNMSADRRFGHCDVMSDKIHNAHVITSVSFGCVKWEEVVSESWQSKAAAEIWEYVYKSGETSLDGVLNIIVKHKSKNYLNDPKFANEMCDFKEGWRQCVLTKNHVERSLTAHVDAEGHVIHGAKA